MMDGHVIRAGSRACADWLEVFCWCEQETAELKNVLNDNRPEGGVFISLKPLPPRSHLIFLLRTGEKTGKSAFK